jgi:DNA-binding transcriptional MerR regulator
VTADRADSAAVDSRTDDSPADAGVARNAGSASDAGSPNNAGSASDAGGRLQSIGRFARSTGLSIGALRHYAEIGLLEPAAVDAATGYRYYRPDQAETARLIGTLRDLDVGLPAIAAILAGTDADRDRAIRDHLARTEAAAWHLQRLAHRLRMLLAEGHDLTTEREKIMPSSTFALDPDDERRLAAALFNRTWDLLLKPERSIADDDEMIHAAHASRHHWGVVGKPVNFARGEWQCSRVYAVLGRAEPALHHASRCLSLTTENDLGPFDVGAANEAMARAYRVAGDPDRVAMHVAAADQAAALITDAEDRKILEDDLADLRP